MNPGELPFVRDMFDAIAPRYDLLNHVLSLRQDVYWRRAMVAALKLAPEARVLDVACGTADVGLEIVRQTGSRVKVVGVDFAPQMLRSAKAKQCLIATHPSIGLTAADAFQLPFAPGGFDAVTIAFGIRNIQNKIEVLNCFHRQLRPGGRLAVLELATPEQGVMRQCYLLYFSRLLPLLGRLVSRHRFAYAYLPESVAKFPPVGRFVGMMQKAGFDQVRYRPLTLGIAVLFVGTKK
ncbi:MAG: bifunctional demethylmenaquinone methyltransferase/2-methoxy-6-polyprenyl-1,4-benzoquinol methylase UbiE [Desulfatitalea sp.]|nr:bifunctional demethylmenaquinone methyltransferase/2-methoxy-6-polyprenyl-1,4-benzoquinol methylase UbiE [Desulfatitalea sp.]NNK00206.1 bifunctional demethylmenaquinone methyltransferase/2-methoxy-6-polyprenyl-1,4-benzoquinol methylase UbiE [Desulfatitalea sp.]